ncbi:hypothetical protein OG588_16985 [Streptomyces prunicolor]|uniref:hypothetical protein n=1 Tax=Streptomyces prunicolor TaxID=67348 RepID=UPI00386D457D|nr:hypothetical protein OG588_16985 [Streptomyces prunicolor]
MTGARKTLWGAVATVVVVAVSAYSAQSRATSPKEVRQLAGSAQALQAREKTSTAYSPQGTAPDPASRSRMMPMGAS